ncbi:hypothetical protein HNQ37_001278, partial [Lactovum miscens]|nr:hypothetical protein [Lactovum miscens]
LFYFIFPNSSIKVSGVFFLLQVANLILQFAKTNIQNISGILYQKVKN